jgi:hypothetical protein
MKRMFLGGLLFLCGFIGIMTLVCISIFKPWEYNGIGGFTGFLLGSGTRSFFYFCCILGVIGIVLCTFEAYRGKQK